jgi:hypothetical protein
MTPCAVPGYRTPGRSARFAALLLAGAALALFSADVRAAQTDGPDVTVIYVSGTSNYTSGGAIDGKRAYSLGTTSCNVGNRPVNWCDESGGCTGLNSNQHPVIAQNFYRLKDGRFEQLGMSWLKHGFLSTNSDDSSCLAEQPTCLDPPRGGHELGVGCTDTYGSSLNGSWSWSGPRSEVNPTTGAYPFPAGNGPTSQPIDQRIQVAETDLDPALNAGALYWGEGHYIADNDGLANNGFNNASHRSFTVGALPALNVTFTGSTVREKPAILAWKTADAAVEVDYVDIPIAAQPTQRFIVARKVTEPVPGTFHYEYAIFNLNSDRAAQRFVVDFADGTTISAVGHKDIDHHSSEPYATTDWTGTVDAGTSSVSWASELYSVSVNANALRWSTLYNFWFEADAAPDAITSSTLTLFKPGMPCRAQISFSPEFIFTDDFETGNQCAWSSEVL